MSESTTQLDVDGADAEVSNENPDKPPKRMKKLAPRAFLCVPINYGKRVAYVMLAAELSVEMQREFTAKQVQDKIENGTVRVQAKFG
ncbi:hypothetical protein H257_07876 [Aphanomyces astaci]|uniref:Uncharacterized protein n=1 Tax=Aphanomyces astaci TaxID=112090 RepID=W4GGV6_APHAT|nr:hypothetical protein H257_07876 [Aphanomyces astaci]ETV78284.1 hypothetical protein H257_07876 [Aphanomyces astaci]|eukprot:XP_009831865.1 hypothetical protein H257_07876 [Aphanomyces astaci]